MLDKLTVPGGFVDLHVHFREPSKNDSENFASGSEAAVIGGFVLACDMPNNPGAETWSEDRVDEKHELIVQQSYCPIGVYAGSQPEADNISEIPGMIRKCVGTKLYMAPTTNNPYDREPEEFREVLKVLKETAPEKPVMLHPGVENLEAMVAMVAGEFGLPVHACHVNNTAQVEVINKAKAKGWQASCGVCVHHLVMTSHDSGTRGWKARMQPPLSRQDEAEALLDRLAKGEIDVIETDHAPHSQEAKARVDLHNPTGNEHDHSNTCYGVPGIEFAAQLMFYQAMLGRISIERLLDAMSTRPAEIIGVSFSPKTKVTWDLSVQKEISSDDVVSGAGWTPFLGMRTVGQVIETRIKGTPVIQNNDVNQRRAEVVKSRGSLI